MINDFLTGILLGCGSTSKPSRYNIHTYSLDLIHTIESECKKESIPYSIRNKIGIKPNHNISFEISLLDKEIVSFIKQIKRQSNIPWNHELFHGYFIVKASFNFSYKKERLILSAKPLFIDSLESFLKKEFHLKNYFIDRNKSNENYVRLMFYYQYEMEQFIHKYGHPDLESLSKLRVDKLAKKLGYNAFSVIFEAEYLIVLEKDEFPSKVFPNWNDTFLFLNELNVSTQSISIIEQTQSYPLTLHTNDS